MATYCLFIRVLGGFQSIADTFAGWTATQEFVETPISASHKIGSDPRLGTITLETWSTKARKMDRGRDKKRSGAQKSADVTTASFEPILESSVALSAGIIHLYKERLNESSFVFPSAAPDPRVSVEQPILGILAVPSYMSPKDLLNFLGPLSEHILHLRILRDATPNRYMVVLKMKGKEAAASLLEELNGVKYHSLEPETCHIVRVSHVQVHHQGSELLDDSSTSVPSSVPSLSMLKKSPSLYLTELPNCPVCLERMDAAVTGLLTIICTHTFHCHCIAKWGDGSCPVCRYSSSKDVADSGKESACGVCGTELDLWICLICGIVGCGRYKHGHARDHFTSSNHMYALEIETQRVWDYAGDGYVHRLLRNREDGKVVELAMPASSSAAPPVPSSASKMDDASPGDFATLLATQLESQRMYFETLLNKIENTHGSELSFLLDKVDALALAQKDLEPLRKDRKVMEKRVDKLLKRVEVLEKDLADEVAMNQSLLVDQKSLSAQIDVKDRLIACKDQELEDLKEQVRDLMFYLETMEKTKDTDLAGASFVATSAEKRPKGKKR